MRTYRRIALACCLLLAWAVPSGAQEYLWRADIKAPVFGNPVVSSDGSTYLACTDERVRAYDPWGNPTWTFILKAKVGGQMALQSGILYVPTQASAIEAVGTNGHRAWEYRLPHHIVGAPALSGSGDVLFTTEDNFLYCLDAGGHLRWKEALPGFVSQGPVVGPDGTVHLGCKDALFAYGTNGQRIWKYTFLGHLTAPLSVGPTGHLLAVANDGRLYCLYSDGTEAWTFDGIAATMAPLVTEDWVYLADGASILAIDLDTGELDWEQAVTASGCPALGEDGVLYVPTKDATALIAAARSDVAGIYSISGIVTGASSVTMTLSGASTATTQTDSGGSYTFTNLDFGDYVVTPTKTGYTFTPANHPVTIEGLDHTGINFTANVAATHKISGTITLGGSAIEGVAVATKGAVATTGTDGKYQLTGLVDGSYTVIPTKTGYNFSPNSQSVTISGADETDVNFSANTVVGHVKLLDTNDGGAILPTGLDIKASGGDIALASLDGEARVVVLNSVPKLFCYRVDAGPMSSAWSQAGAGPRRQSRMDTPPSVTLGGLQDGQTVSGDVSCEAVVEDPDTAGITARLYVNGALMATAQRPPFVFIWHTEGTPDGEATVTVEVSDLGGSRASDSVVVTVDNGASPALIFYADDPPQAFTWVAPADENRFKVQCASDAAFERKVATSVDDKAGWIYTASWTPYGHSWKGVLSVASGVTQGDALGYWRVIGKTAGSFYYGTYLVKGQEPAQPLGPPDGGAVSAASPPTFTWLANHNKKFRVEFSGSADFSTGVLVDSATSQKPWIKGASWTPSGKKWKKILAVGQTVHWRVRATDSLGRTTAQSPVYAFVVD